MKNNGDSWTDRSKPDFHIFMKNEGEADWKVDQYVKLGMITNGLTVDGKIEDLKGLDITKNIVIRVEVKTENGNILWNEVVRKPHELRKKISGKNYEIKDGSAPNISTNNSTGNDQNDSGNDTKTDNGKITNTNTSNGTGNQLKPDKSGKPDNSGGKITTTNTTTTAGSTGPATDLTTKTIRSQCKEAGAGDTIVNINGSIICIDSYKHEKSKWISGTIANAVNIEVSGMIFPLAGNSNIKMNKLTGNLVSGKLRAPLTYTNEAGEFEIKDGSVVTFEHGKLYRCRISKDVTLQAGDKSIVCTSNAKRKYDLQFDPKGTLEECTLAEPLSVKGETIFNFPSNTTLKMKDYKIWRVFCQEASSFTLDGKTINVQISPSNKKPSYDFTYDFKLTEVISGAGNTIEIEGQKISIEAGKPIKFENDTGTLLISKFFVATPVTITVYGKKTKETTVKSGKKIVLKDGKVVKAG